VLADVRTFAKFGLHACAVVTSVTFQNSKVFVGAVHQTADAVRAQIESVLGEFTIICAKTGMLPNREIVMEVARLFRETNLPAPVVDPVIVSSTGHVLMEPEALAALQSELLPLACLVTPNILEAETLTGMTIRTESDMRQAAAMIRERGARAVLVKGGHLGETAEGRRQEAEKEAIDVLDDEGAVTVFRAARVEGGELHGSGCILSAAIAAGLGNGMMLEESVRTAKSFVLEVIRNSNRSE